MVNPIPPFPISAPWNSLASSTNNLRRQDTARRAENGEPEPPAVDSTVETMAEMKPDQYFVDSQKHLSARAIVFDTMVDDTWKAAREKSGKGGIMATSPWTMLSYFDKNPEAEEVRDSLGDCEYTMVDETLFSPTRDTNTSSDGKPKQYLIHSQQKQSSSPTSTWKTNFGSYFTKSMEAEEDYDAIYWCE